MGNHPDEVTSRRLSFLPIPVLMVSMAVIHFAVKPAIFFEPAWLLPITNAVFVTGVCFVVAYVAMKNYLATARIQILLLGCGLLSFGLGGVIAGWVRSFPDGANLNVTIYNTAALLGAIFHFVAAFILLAGVSPEVGAKQKKTWLVFSYAAIAAFTALLTLATMRRIIPAFFVQGVGATALRQVVLGSADVLFIFSFLIFMGWYLRRGEAFLYWYASALALTAISLTGFFIQSAVGSPIGWLSRFSQYLGGIYFIVAVATAIRTARVRKTSIDLALAAALSPSEESFLRTTFDNMAERLIVCDSQGNILLVNDAARKTYGIEEQVPWQVSTLNEAIEVLDLDGRPLPLSLRPLTR
ncbi:MAG: PAS domain S-box protein, partial [Candidatus Korobacteraceae bacterium]